MRLRPLWFPGAVEELLHGAFILFASSALAPRPGAPGTPAFAPLARLPYPMAKRVFWWINLAAVMGTALVLGFGVLSSGWGPPLQRSLICLAALAVMAPTHIALRHAQTTPLIT